ncbi:hypothetical protein EUTSA_v10002957mg [Eutrema salsugineum]|uniref:F-box domain-containing protein n=1 Tax=Eutrema salsugineum TaxID=72664 RepID=V4L0M4_EUTSA|nr:hypothetical protein EUTSA_v10002957mg [Eutrema salsugineum]
MISDLPLNLESTILSRVPANSLSKLRSTCKRWYALFKDPRFIKNWGTQVILKKDYGVYSGSVSLHGIHNSIDPSFEVTYSWLWNPCTGQTRSIRSNNRLYSMVHTYFLGYENKNRSCGGYKILSIGIYLVEQKRPRIEIYEFNSDSWRALDDVKGDWTVLTYWCNLSYGVSLKGNTYWLKNYHYVSSIVMFDFTTERLGHISLPFHNVLLGEMTPVLSVVREEKLALLRFDRKSSEMKIWVSNMKIDEPKNLSWSYFLVVDFDKLMIQDMTKMVSFLVDEENKMVVYCDECIGNAYDQEIIRIYIAGENMHKEVYKETKKRSLPYDRPLLLSYVPSLVHIDLAT